MTPPTPPAIPVLASVLIGLVLLPGLVGLTRAAAVEPATGDGGWRWPITPPEVVRGFHPPDRPYGPGHRGIDLAGRPGQPVVATHAGVVWYAGTVANRGVVSVVHAGGLRSTYEPVAAVVRRGQRLAGGDRLGTLVAGHPGCPRPACLHWGLLHGARYVNPLALVAGTVRLLPLGEAAASVAPPRGSHPADVGVAGPGPPGVPPPVPADGELGARADDGSATEREANDTAPNGQRDENEEGTAPVRLVAAVLAGTGVATAVALGRRSRPRYLAQASGRRRPGPRYPAQHHSPLPRGPPGHAPHRLNPDQNQPGSLPAAKTDTTAHHPPRQLHPEQHHSLRDKGCHVLLTTADPSQPDASPAHRLATGPDIAHHHRPNTPEMPSPVPPQDLTPPLTTADPTRRGRQAQSLHKSERGWVVYAEARHAARLGVGPALPPLAGPP